MDFKKKYLKYKQKYLELQNKLNGGKFPLIDGDITVPNDDPNCMFDIFLIAWLTRNNVNAQFWGSDYIYQLKKFMLEYATQNQFTYFYDRNNSSIPPKLMKKYGNGTLDYFNRKEFVIWMKTITLRQTHQIVPNQIQSLIDPPEINAYNTLEPVNVILEVSLGIGSATVNHVTTMNNRINNNGHTYIIDYQNVLNILLNKIASFYRININNNRIMLELLAVKQIKKFIVSRNNADDKVILIYKPSNNDYTFNGNIIDYDLLLTHLCGHPTTNNDIRLWNGVIRYGYNHTVDVNHSIIIKNKISRNQLEIISYNERNHVQYTSNSYDDLTFWMIGVAYYKLYHSHSKIGNIHFVTNDMQKLDNAYFKNILNLGLHPMGHKPLDIYNSSDNTNNTLIERIDYYILQNNNLTSRKVVQNDDRISQCLQILYSALYESGNGNISTLLNGEDIRETIFTRKFWFDNITEITGEMNYAEGITLINAVHNSPDTLYTAKVINNGERQYILPYYFYACIKGIQFSKYNGDYDGSMTQNQIEHLFYNGI
jgi:hypothetical protein